MTSHGYLLNIILLGFVLVNKELILVDAACEGSSIGDHCELGFYSIPNPTETTICIVCPHNGKNQPNVLPPPIPKVPDGEPPPPSPITRPVPPPTVPPIQPVCPSIIPLATTANCLRRNIRSSFRDNVLSSCQDLDSLLFDLETAQHALQSGMENSNEEHFANWLRKLAFSIKCPSLIQRYKLKSIEWSERRVCRGTLELTVSYTFGDIEYFRWPDPPAHCPRQTLPQPTILTLVEIFTLPTRKPTLEDLEPSEVIAAGMNLKCLSELPSVAELPSSKTVSLGSNCNGSQVTVTYDMRIEEVNLAGPEFPACLDHRTVSHIWETRSPIDNSTCEQDTLRAEFTIYNDELPTLVSDTDELPPGGGDDYAYYLQCYSELINYPLYFASYCNKTHLRRATIASSTMTNLTNIAAMGCANNAAGTVTFSGMDECGNEVRQSRRFILRDKQAPVPDEPITFEAHYKCRRHVPPAANISASDNCLGKGLSFSLFKQDYEFPPSARRQVQLNQTNSITLTCEDDLDILRTYILSDGCSIPMEIVTKAIVRNQEGPRWTGILPPQTLTFQCGFEVPSFELRANRILGARDDCDQEDLEIVGEETMMESSGPDRFVLTRTWKAMNHCGNIRSFVQRIVVHDTIAPALIDNFDREAHFCSFQGAETTDKYACLPNMKARILGLTKEDNCKRERRVDFIRALTYSCADGEQIETCVTPRQPARGQILVNYEAELDTLCFNLKHTQLHIAEFRVLDASGNAAEVKIDLYNPRRTTDDQYYDPQFPHHPCDGRNVFPKLTTPYKKEQTSFGGGDIYLSNKANGRR